MANKIEKLPLSPQQIQYLSEFIIANTRDLNRRYQKVTDVNIEVEAMQELCVAMMKALSNYRNEKSRVLTKLLSNFKTPEKIAVFGSLFK